MSESILSIDHLNARVEEKEILHDINLKINRGETHVLMGPNGAGKSTLGYVLMGNPKYEITDGTIYFKGRDITQETVDKRSQAGMFLSFQEPLEVPGLTLSSFIRNAISQKKGSHIKLWDFKKALEKKKAEILQLMMLKPKLAILDETDSGLDVDAVRLVSKGVEEYQKNRDGALLIITHSTRILEALHVDYTHVMVNGHIVATGDGALVDRINEEGYESFVSDRAEEVKEQ